jgi:prolyl 4-hydroxylase
MFPCSRTNIFKAYVPHMDWIHPNTLKWTQDHFFQDLESFNQGINRYGTILLYMNDMKENDGGETVFVQAYPTGQAKKDRVDLETSVKNLRESGDANSLEEGSWEEEMAALCRTRLSIQPRAGRAVLFYSQLPDGQPDPSSVHGGCPVLSGTKVSRF